MVTCEKRVVFKLNGKDFVTVNPLKMTARVDCSPIFMEDLRAERCFELAEVLQAVGEFLRKQIEEGER